MLADVFLNTMLFTAIPFLMIGLITMPDWYPVGLERDGKTPRCSGSGEDDAFAQFVILMIAIIFSVFVYQVQENGRGAILALIANVSLTFLVPMVIWRLRLKKLRREFRSDLESLGDEDEFERILRHFEYASVLIDDEKISQACADVVPALKVLIEDEALRKSYDGRIAMHSIQILGEILDRKHLMRIESWPEGVRESFLKGLIGFGEIAQKIQVNAQWTDGVEDALEALLAQQAKTGVVASS